MGSNARRSLASPLHSAAMPEAVECPFCDDVETEQLSAFGSALSVGQYYCRTCRTVFEWMKRKPPAPSGDDA
jgi:hypothetical protein